MKEQLTETIKKAVGNMLKKEGIKEVPRFALIIPDNDAHGDYATNIAMQIAKPLKRSPKAIAEDIAQEVEKELEGEVQAEAAGPGFINFTLSKTWFRNTVKEILKNDSFFDNDQGKGIKVILEFVSANPTGPLHIGHGRGAAYGDSLARILSASGFEVYREYYLNNAGNQMKNLGKSVYCRILEEEGLPCEFPENGYHGDYIKDIAQTLLAENPKILKVDQKEAEAICLAKAVETISRNIREDLKNFRTEFDNWFSENSLYKSGAVEKVLKKLAKGGHTYEKDGALWLATEIMGDDKDRVLRKSSGEYTYFTPDIAYHENKYGRGFDRLIDVWGADHHGYVKRMTCAVEALGHDGASFEASLIQMVNLIKNGEKVSMSTRSGSFIPLSWLMDEVGVDAARFFYNMRSHDAQFDFDIDLAKSKNSENPVYYIQYAHARVFSLMSNAIAKGCVYKEGRGVERLVSDEEMRLIKNMIRLKYAVELAAAHLEPHRIAYQLLELAGAFHGYYYNNQIIVLKDEELTSGRLTLCNAVATTIRRGLDLLGVSAPERM